MYVFFFNSMSLSTESKEGKNLLVYSVLQTCQQILTNAKYITYCWNQSHRAVKRNEETERCAKDTLSLPQPQCVKFP